MTDSFKDRIKRWQGKRIVVWGDFVADHTVLGSPSRISREAPVLILDKEGDELAPGGAGNAVMNVASLGAKPLPVGVVGNDAMGKRLCRLFKKKGIDTSGLLVLPNVETAVKMRVLAGGLHTVKQQVIRIDSGGNYGKVPAARLQSKLKRALQQADAAIVSDYGLGSVSPGQFKSILGRRSLLTVVDSRYELGAFQGADSATPNEPELERVSGIALSDDNSALDRAGKALRQKLRLKALLVTRGKRGMALFQSRHPRRDIPIHGSDDIVDVTGAGDTVIAAYTLALTAGADFMEAARISNVAGGLSVMVRGAAAVKAAALRKAMS